MLIRTTLDLLDPSPSTVMGNHSIWIPELELKVPFQWGGKVTKRTRHEATYPRESIADEWCILRALAAEGMAPRVGGFVFYRNVVSDYPGAWHCDPCGAYGFGMEDANGLPPGKFSLDAMRRLPIEGSDAAWNDAVKPDNVVNGYLVDVRRTGWDLLRWKGERVELPDARDDPAQLVQRVHRDCQFPAGKRDLAYQEFWVRHEQQRGQRNVVERAVRLGFTVDVDVVLDIGTQGGGFLQFAHSLSDGRGRYAGVDASPTYIDCARAIARSCDMNICYRAVDVNAQRQEFLSWVAAYFPDGVGHLLLLSMEKHLGEDALLELVDAIGARHTYIETNAVAEDDGQGDPPDGPMKLWAEVNARGGVYLGDSRDRNLRRLYRIDRQSGQGGAPARA